MIELIFTVGLPASGKTKWATDFIKRKNNYSELKFVNVNRDDIRMQLFGANTSPDYDFKNNKETLVSDVQECMIISAFKKGISVIVSDTNLNTKSVNKLSDIAIRYGAKISFNKDFLKVPVEVCIARDAFRERTVGEKVIRDMYERYKDKFTEDMNDVSHYNNDFEKQSSRIYEPDENLPKAFIFDIDGTLADMSGHRGPYDAHRYHFDRVHSDVADLCNHLSGHFVVVILSGREGTLEGSENTKKWLVEHNIPYNEIFMRAEGDMRRDSIVKKELFFNHVASKYNVLGVFDDRKQVVRMWRDIGVRCYQVEENNF